MDVGDHTRRDAQTGEQMTALDVLLDNVEATGHMLESIAASTITTTTTGLNLPSQL